MALSWTMDKIGPMCRSVEDCVLVLNAIYGSDGRDDTIVDAPFDWVPDRPLSSLRVGFVQSEFESGPKNTNATDAQRQAFKSRKPIYADALEVFRKAGAKLEPISMP